MTRIKYRVNYSGEAHSGESAALNMGSETLVKKSPADRAYNFLLPVQFIEGIGFEHDTFAVSTMGETKEMPDLVGSFLDNAIDKIIVIPPPAIIFIVQACRGNYAGSHGFAGQAEDETVPVPEQVLVDDQQHRPGNIVPVLVCLDTVQQGLGINLPADHIQSRYTHMVLGHRGFNSEDRFNAPRHRQLESGGRL